MTATVILNPAAAADTVCHEEQLQIWAHELMVTLGMGGYLNEDLDYSELAALESTVRQELKGIIEMAFDHPEARTIMRKAT